MLKHVCEIKSSQNQSLIMLLIRRQLEKCLVRSSLMRAVALGNSKGHLHSSKVDRSEECHDEEFEQLLGDREFDEFKDNFISGNRNNERAYVIQPWIKWGPDKLINTTANLMMGKQTV
jgi:hypothetical protein